MLQATRRNSARSCSSNCSRFGTDMPEGTNFSRLDVRSKRVQSAPSPRKPRSGVLWPEFTAKTVLAINVHCHFPSLVSGMPKNTFRTTVGILHTLSLHNATPLKALSKLNCCTVSISFSFAKSFACLHEMVDRKIFPLRFLLLVPANHPTGMFALPTHSRHQALLTGLQPFGYVKILLITPDA